MDFLKKAKAKIHEIEGDLTKATQALGVGEHHDEASTPSASSSGPPADGATPASTAMNTPATSAAPSVAGGASQHKLPMAIRKDVRDDYEHKIPELEAKLSAVCGVPWKIHTDPGLIYTTAGQEYLDNHRGNFGKMLHNYFSVNTQGVKNYIEKYGNEGKNELNKLASSHTMTLEPVTTQDFFYCGSELSGGCLRIMFKKDQLGVNLDRGTSDLDKAVNTAGAAAPGASTLDFDAKHGIKSKYDPGVGEVHEKLQRTLALPVLTLTPNFEHNFSIIDKFEKSNEMSTIWPREWRKNLGANTLAYFNAVYKAVDQLGFGKDDMLQEGLKDAMEKNEIQLRVVDKLVKGYYNEAIFENGVLIIQTTPPMWTTNIGDCAMKLVDLL